MHPALLYSMIGYRGKARDYAVVLVPITLVTE